MKVTENSDARLVLSHSPWLLAGLVGVLSGGCLYGVISWDASDGGLGMRALVALIGIGVAVLGWWAFPFTRTVFDRQAGIVVHEERRLTGRRIQAHPLGTLRKAQVRSNRDADGGRLTRLVLILDADEFPLEKGFQSQDRRAAEDAVNEWLTRPTGP